MKEKLKLLFEKKTLTKSDKEYIEEAAKQIGIPFTPKGKCINCYFDVLVKIRLKLKEEENTPNKGCDYLLDPVQKIDVIHKGVRINAATLTNEKAILLINDGLLRWFSKYPREKHEDLKAIQKKNLNSEDK